MELKSLLNWDEYFMSVAILAALRSKDPSSKVGACIVDAEHKVVSLGYNGMPRGVDETKLSWEKGEGLDNKYLYVAHAEFNAILNTRSGSSLKDTTIYVTLFPCNECAKALIQVGVKEVVYLEDKYADTIPVLASKKLLQLANIKVRKYEGKVLTPSFHE